MECRSMSVCVVFIGTRAQEGVFLDHVLPLHGVRRVPFRAVLCIAAFHKRSGRSTCRM